MIQSNDHISSFISVDDDVTKIVHESWTDLQRFTVYEGDDLLKRINPKYVIEVGYTQSESQPEVGAPMPDYLVELEVSSLETYKITAVDEEDARETVLRSRLALDAVEEHEQVKVRQCVRCFD